MEHPDAAFDLSALPAPIRRVVEQKIKPDETILWAGQPDARRFFQERAGALVYGLLCLAGIVVFVVFVFNTSQTTRTIDNGNFFVILLFALVISFAIITSPIVDFCDVRQKVYVVTSQRAFSIIYSPGSENEVLPVIVHHPENLKSVVRKDGTGTLLFYHEADKRTFKQRWNDSFQGTVSYYPLTEFTAIKDVRKVEGLIRNLYFSDR